MFAYTALLDTLSGEEIYGWRILFTLPLLTVFIGVQGYWSQVIVIYQRIIREKHFWLTRIASSFFNRHSALVIHVGSQQWIWLSGVTWLFYYAHHYGGRWPIRI